jgi:hypothetical protein
VAPFFKSSLKTRENGSSFGRRWMSSTKVIRICFYRTSLRNGKAKKSIKDNNKGGGINTTRKKGEGICLLRMKGYIGDTVIFKFFFSN